MMLQIATYKVRTVRVVDERAVNDSANDGSGHVTRPANPPKMDSSSVRMSAMLLYLLSMRVHDRVQAKR